MLFCEHVYDEDASLSPIDLPQIKFHSHSADSVIPTPSEVDDEVGVDRVVHGKIGLAHVGFQRKCASGKQTAIRGKSCRKSVPLH